MPFQDPKKVDNFTRWDDKEFQGRQKPQLDPTEAIATDYPGLPTMGSIFLGFIADDRWTNVV